MSDIDGPDSIGVIEFLVGGDAEISLAMDAGVRGMKIGDNKTFPLGNEDGYPEHREDWVVQYERKAIEEQLGDDQVLEVGGELAFQGSHASVVEATETSVTLDFNHPLAGKHVKMLATLTGCAPPAEKPEVVVESLRPGDNATFPKYGDKVSLECTGSFVASGEVFYSTQEKGAPYEFRLGARQAIEGLELGLLKISLGERARINIPAALAYGQQSDSVEIPVAKDVIFEVELLSIA